MAVFLRAVEVNDAVPEEMVRRMWENLPPQRRSRLERQKNAEKALEALAAYWILRTVPLARRPAAHGLD